MPVTSTWTDPSAGGALDKATGATLDEAYFDALASNLLVLGGATGYVTQRPAVAVGVTSSPTTTSTTYVDLTDLAVTLTTTGGDLDVDFSGTFSLSTTGDAVFVGLSLDGAAEVGERGVTLAAVYLASLSSTYRFTGVAAGAHTVKVRWRVTAGTGTANGTRRGLRVTEVKR